VSPIETQWDDSQPIYRQLRDRVVAMMLEGVLKEGEALPSVRQVAAEYRLNPLTCQGHQRRRRGAGERRAGRFVRQASKALMKDERARFWGGRPRPLDHPAPGLSQKPC
jgi:GntR family transcriptional regulator